MDFDLRLVALAAELNTMAEKVEALSTEDRHYIVAILSEVENHADFSALFAVARDLKNE